MRKTWWKSGDWNALCDQCGFKRKSEELIKRWDGLMVCRPTVKPGCWELRHPQELIRPIPDMQPLPWTRPEPEDQFISNDLNPFTGCTALSILSQADYGQANCATVDNVNGGLVP